MDRVIKGEVTQAKRTMSVFLTSSLTGVGVPSLTFSGAEVMVNINGGGWVNATGTLPEDGGSGNGKGCYTYQMVSGDVAAAGSIKLLVTKAGCDLWLSETDIDDVTTEGLTALSALVEGSDTHGDVLRDMRAVLAGVTSGYQTGTVVAKSQDGAKIRRTYTVASAGRLTSVKGDLT